MPNRETVEISLANAAVTALEDIGDPVSLGGVCKVVAITVKNTGAQALNAFTVQAKTHPTGAWIDMISATDWDEAANATGAIGWTGQVINTTADPVTLAGGASAFLMFRVDALKHIRIKAGVAASTAAVTIYGLAY